VSSRGWCYTLEPYGLLKSDFDAAQRLINDCRKSGLLLVDLCAEDGKRAFSCVEELDSAHAGSHAAMMMRSLRRWCDQYAPVSFWEGQPVYIEMLVEKVDLRNLFAPVCERYHIPIANTGGNADLNQRYEMMRRFAEHERAGRECVLLYCGDFDPAGLRISDGLRSNLADLAGAAGWEPDNLIVDRFGLNHDFIVANRLTWIDNLQTGNDKLPPLDNPRHPDHGKPYVKEYLAAYGARKVEANALVVAPEAGRKLAEDAILRWLVDAASPERYKEALEPWRAGLVDVVEDNLLELWRRANTMSAGGTR